MKKSFLLILLCSGITFAQEIESDAIEVTDTLTQYYTVKRLSLGIKVGVPNIIGFSAEGVTPLFGNRIAPFIDYSGFNINPDDVKASLTYTVFGSNFYFGDKGKGAYVGIGFGNLNTDLTFNNIQLEDDFGNSGNGTAFIAENISTTNLKLGIKTGGRIYFRLELGYGFADIPESVEVQGEFTYTAQNGETLNSQGSEIEDFPTVPGVGANGILIGNFGFGFSF